MSERDNSTPAPVSQMMVGEPVAWTMKDSYGCDYITMSKHQAALWPKKTPLYAAQPAPAEHVTASYDAVREASIAARYHRLHRICERILWTDIGAPAMGNPQTQAAMTELSELMFTDALIAATATSEGSTDAV